MAVAFLPQVARAAGDVVINAKNFPDENFLNYLLKQDYGKDGKLTEEEIKNITELNVSDKGIRSLQGIEHFTALTKLDCHNNQLTSLNVLGCSALTELDCANNQLAALDVSGYTALTKLNCRYNQLTSLNVSGCTALAELYCSGNQLRILNASGCIALTKLELVAS